MVYLDQISHTFACQHCLVTAFFGGQSVVSVTGYRYMIHFYCLAVEAGFYSDVVECLPVGPATLVRFPAGAGKIFSLYDNGAHRK